MLNQMMPYVKFIFNCTNDHILNQIVFKLNKSFKLTKMTRDDETIISCRRR